MASGEYYREPAGAMQRDFDALGARRFDLLVVGGGIHGLFAAYEAASRGLSTALVEASDFGSGATFIARRSRRSIAM